MAVSVNIEVVGLKEALKTINTLDKQLRRQITKDFKIIVAPVIADAISILPTGKAPLSGMARSWKGKSGRDIMSWDASRPPKNIKAFTSGKKVRDAPGGFRQNLATFGIKWVGPQGSIFDMAGQASPNSRLAKALTAKYGLPSRAIWKAFNNADDMVEFEVKQLVKKVMLDANRLGGTFP